MDELEGAPEERREYSPMPQSQPQIPAYAASPAAPPRPSTLELIFQNKIRFFLMTGFLFLLIGAVIWSIGAGVSESRVTLQHVVAPIFLEIAVFFVLLGCVDGLLKNDTEPLVKLILGFMLLFLVMLLLLAFTYSMLGMFVGGGL